MPNHEVTDMEVPGRSSSEDEPQDASVSGGESLMGTLIRLLLNVQLLYDGVSSTQTHSVALLSPRHFKQDT